MVRRQTDQGPGQFDMLGQVFSSFRKFSSAQYYYNHFEICILMLSRRAAEHSRRRGREVCGPTDGGEPTNLQHRREHHGHHRQER